jgi:hypothetical protein
MAICFVGRRTQAVIQELFELWLGSPFQPPRQEEGSLTNLAEIESDWDAD